MRWTYTVLLSLLASFLIRLDAFSAPRPHLGRRNVQKSTGNRRVVPVTASAPLPVAVNVNVARVTANDRLQKVIAHSGLASRRTAEEMV